MSNDNFSAKNFERFMRESAPDLQKLLERERELPPERVARLKTLMEAHRPFLRELSKVQMRQVLLQVFKTSPMDGTDLAALLRKSNVKLKDATGEGEIYGLLRELENANDIESDWKDGINRQKRVYKLTDSGRAKLQRLPAEESALADAILARAAS